MLAVSSRLKKEKTMNIPKRRLGCAISATLMVFCALAATASEYPARPIRIVVPQGAGGSTDLTARLVGQRLSDVFGQPVIVDNRPGAGSIHGTDVVVKASPDGHTLLVVGSSVSLNPLLHKKLPFDPQRDLAPVTRLTFFSNLVVAHPSVPAKSIGELIALAKTKPGQLSFASSGVATGPHLSAELFKHMAGIDMVHVPYKGAAPANTAVLAGEVQLVIASTVALLPHVRAGKLRGLAVTTSRRSPVAPDIPTVMESGLPEYEHNDWNGMFAPAKTPREVIARVNTEVIRILQTQDVSAFFLQRGSEPAANSPEEFAAFIRSYTPKWKKVIKAAGITAN
jgi:tripartite-type tricarboxylate transporter receptor subunit TctC